MQMQTKIRYLLRGGVRMMTVTENRDYWMTRQKEFNSQSVEGFA